MKGKSCGNCNYSRKIDSTMTKDFKYIKGKFECSNFKVTLEFMDKFNWDIENLATYCEYYDAKLIDSCLYCNKSINKPEWNWDFWVKDLFENLPVCSKKCYDNFNKEFKKKMSESQIDAEKYDDFI